MAVVSEYEVRVRSTDIDGDGIVNNAHYFEFFEQARLEHLSRMEIIRRPRPPGDRSRAFTIAETTCRYRAPLRHRDEVVVRAWTQSIGNRSFVLGYDIRLGDSDSVCAEGSSVQVWLDADGKPTPLPDDVREALERSMADAASPVS